MELLYHYHKILIHSVALQGHMTGESQPSQWQSGSYLQGSGDDPNLMSDTQEVSINPYMLLTTVLKYGVLVGRKLL